VIYVRSSSDRVGILCTAVAAGGPGAGREFGLLASMPQR
jgi:hypothetical protein